MKSRNPYQLIALNASGKFCLLGTFNTHAEAVEQVRAVQSRNDGIYLEFRITRLFQYELIATDEQGHQESVGLFRNKVQAEQAQAKMAEVHANLSIEFIGGISDE